MHDGLFAAPSVNSEQQRAVAETLGLDMIAFEECRLSGAAKAAVEQAADVSTAFAIQSTPTFYLGSPTGNGGVTVTQVIAGARPLSVFTEAIDSLVARAD